MTETSLMTEPVRIALAQMCSGRDVAGNLEAIATFAADAKADGALYLQTPEVSTMMEMRSADLFAKAEPAEANTALDRLADIAAKTGLWLHVGSMVVRVGDDKVANRAVLFKPDGTIAATYDKMHMFDVTVGDGERYRESKNYRPGSQAVIVDTPFARIGLTICYDMRFPRLYATLADARADIITVPSAFTVPTGKAHWHTLLRARAIETQAFVLAAAQVGDHECGRSTYGHSLAIGPWGDVIADGGAESTGLVFADLDPAALEKARGRVPSLEHGVPIIVTHVDANNDQPKRAHA
jgi:predicted amidohydrolase